MQSTDGIAILAASKTYINNRVAYAVEPNGTVHVWLGTRPIHKIINPSTEYVNVPHYVLRKLKARDVLPTSMQSIHAIPKNKKRKKHKQQTWTPNNKGKRKPRCFGRQDEYKAVFPNKCPKCRWQEDCEKDTYDKPVSFDLSKLTDKANISKIFRDVDTNIYNKTHTGAQ